MGFFKVLVVSKEQQTKECPWYAVSCPSYFFVLFLAITSFHAHLQEKPGRAKPPCFGVLLSTSEGSNVANHSSRPTHTLTDTEPTQADSIQQGWNHTRSHLSLVVTQEALQCTCPAVSKEQRLGNVMTFGCSGHVLSFFLLIRHFIPGHLHLSLSLSLSQKKKKKEESTTFLVCMTEKEATFQIFQRLTHSVTDTQTVLA